MRCDAELTLGLDLLKLAETHGAYGAFFRNDVKGTAKKITFD